MKDYKLFLLLLFALVFVDATVFASANSNSSSAASSSGSGEIGYNRGGVSLQLCKTAAEQYKKIDKINRERQKVSKGDPAIHIKPGTVQAISDLCNRSMDEYKEQNNDTSNK